MDRVKLTFLGQAGVALTYQGQTLVTDPHLSDYLSTIASDACPWVRKYAPPTDLASLAPAGIVISHAHEDHLDPWTLAPYYENGGKAPLVLPAPVAEKAAFCPNAVPAREGKTVQVGPFSLTPIPCAHTELHPNEAGEYYELSYTIVCGNIRIFFGGDLSLYEGLRERLIEEKYDIMILPVNGADEDRTSRGIIGNINEVEAAQLARDCGAILLPMHHDLYAINGCEPAAIRAAAAQTGARLMLLSVMQSAVYSK